MSTSPKNEQYQSSTSLKQRFDEKAETARKHPELARHRASASVRLVYGFACDVEHEDRMLRVDLPREDGGGATGPHPGQLLRSCLGACLLMDYKIWGARLEVPIDAVELDISCEYDERGWLGVDPEVPVGWTNVTIDIRIASPADPRAVRHVVETAHRLSPMLANLSAGIERVFRLQVIAPAGGDAGRRPGAGHS